MRYNNMPCVIVDIDGTLSDLTHRLHHIQGPKKDWDSFYSDLDKDTVNRDMADLVEVISYSWPIVLCTGRPDNYRDLTLKWLNDYDICFDALYMRIAGDHREDYIIKQEFLQEIKKDYAYVVAAIDDRKQVVDMWRSNGILCLQCAEGNF